MIPTVYACLSIASCTSRSDDASSLSTTVATLPLAPGYRLLGKNNKPLVTIRPRLLRNPDTMESALYFVTGTGKYGLLSRDSLLIDENEVLEPNTNKKVKAITFATIYSKLTNKCSIALSQDSEYFNSIKIRGNPLTGGQDKEIRGRPEAETDILYDRIPNLKQEIFVDVPLSVGSSGLPLFIKEDTWTPSMRLTAKINAIFTDHHLSHAPNTKPEIAYTAQVNGCLSWILGQIDGFPVMMIDPQSGREKIIGFVEGSLSQKEKNRGMFQLQVRSVLNEDVLKVLGKVRVDMKKADLSNYQNQFDDVWKRQFCSPSYVAEVLEERRAQDTLNAKSCPMPQRISRDPFIYGSCRPDKVMAAIRARIEKDAVLEASSACKTLTIDQKVEQIARAAESRMLVHICPQSVDEAIRAAIAKDAQCSEQ